MALLKRKHDRYMELVQELPLKTIHTEKELLRAEKMLHQLLDIEQLDGDEKDYLEVLGKLIKEFEDQRYPMDGVTGAQLLAHLIESKGVSHRQVAQATGINETAISNLLAGRREFNRNHIERLSHYFRIRPDAFFSK
jgi:HTH-type transcriptional regulator/antitoxin HigA